VNDMVHLTESWNRFCEILKETGELSASWGPDRLSDRTAGYRVIARSIALALQLSYENVDPYRPELMRYFDPIRKLSGDHGDGLYVYAPIHHGSTYRISGERGSANYISFVVSDAAPTPWGGAVTAELNGDDLLVDSDGRFELIVSPEHHPGNWLKTGPNSSRLLIRQFFADWAQEAPMIARIDRLPDPADDRAPTSERDFAPALIESAEWLKNTISYFVELMEKWKKRRNEFVSWPQLEGKMGNTPGGVALTCYWEVPEDEALIIRVSPPEARYWSVELGNYWWETVDYRYRLSGTNMHYAVREDDGELIVVLAHDDPGVPNWLDASVFSAGYVTYRWMGTDVQPAPVCTQVKRCDLWKNLPPNVKSLGPSEREAQLDERRRGVSRRFPY
jgi:hypothetical protein